MSVALLTEEHEAYEAEKENLLLTSEGRYVLIRGSEIVGVFDTASEAIGHGYRTFGNVPFLVKVVARIESPVSFVNHFLGI